MGLCRKTMSFLNNKPKLVIVTGRPGSGKTTLSKKLGQHICFPVVYRDQLKEGYVNTFNRSHNQLPENTNQIVTDIFFNTVELLLTNKVSIIAEAAFQHSLWEPQISRFQHYATVLIILCEIDQVIAAQRHLKRELSNSKRAYYHGDKRVTHFQKTGRVLPPGTYQSLEMNVPTIKVSTVKGYNPTLEKIS